MWVFLKLRYHWAALFTASQRTCEINAISKSAADKNLMIRVYLHTSGPKQVRHPSVLVTCMIIKFGDL